MLYNLLTPLAEDYQIFNLFRYLTFRTGGALFTAFFIALIIGPRLIAWLKGKQKTGQPIREDGPSSHIIAKQGTPTMGGFLILAALLISTILWADSTNSYVWAALIVTTGFGLIGFVDDYLKVTQGSSSGVPGRIKLVAEAAIAAAAVYWIAQLGSPTLALPFVKNLLIDMGWFYIPFGVLVIVGASNSVNLT
ncbi:MAG: phospho-N-acetylmuramoyl-pentapeptide-transferase, partial [Sphingomonadales bacterium]